MTEIFIDEKEIKYRDWAIWVKEDGRFMLTVTYLSGKKYTRPYEECKVEPVVNRKETLLFNKQKNTYSEISSAVEVGGKYFFITYPSNEKIFLLKCEQFVLEKSEDITQSQLFGYFRSIAQERLDNAQRAGDKIIAQNIVSQFGKIVPCRETALYAYLSKNLKSYEEQKALIYPFGVNETQMNAVKNAFKSQISIIEGPPGTGKTQTILNIIANIVVNGKTCAIVSNNNSAVENVYKKLRKAGLQCLVAELGNTDKRMTFFENISYEKPEFPDVQAELEEIKELFEKLEEYLGSKNELAKLVNEIQEIEIEKKYLLEWLNEHPEVETDYIRKYNLDCKKLVSLLAYLTYIENRTLTIRDKWNLLSGYKIFRTRFLNSTRNRGNFIFSLQLTYYEKLLKEANEKKEELEKILKEADFDDNLKRSRQASMAFLRRYICQQMPDKISEFTIENYRGKFSEFIKTFPVIGSSTHSLVSSIGAGYLLDYVIIDEASQQDLVPGVLCLGCARNAVIVGDRKQLSHIAVQTNIAAPEKLYDCSKYSLLDSVSKVFENIAPRTLLREHYRCHPRIIQFCNRQFYDNELIPMTEDHGEDALTVIFTTLGNHMRNYRNQREIESVMQVDETCGFLTEENIEDNRSVGFIAPYNNQVRLAEQMLPEQIVENTIHKFQGGECDEIIFSTVLDKKAVSQRQIDFVDNAELINVAVSRAKNKFTLVTGRDVFTENNKYIAALIRYIEYYGSENAVVESPVISAFDLLYSEYDKSLEGLADRLNPKDSRFKSEQIVSALLKELLQNEEFKSLTFYRQVYLKQLVVNVGGIFSEREEQYIKNLASCDFVMYYRIGKKPVAVIEVDGKDHEQPQQTERDSVKDSILKKAGIPLLRLRTTDSSIMQKLSVFIRQCLIM